MKPLCYCCDQPGTTDEHVPPLCLFPERKDLPAGVDLRRNLITVPSCLTHNLKKSGDDEDLMYILTMNLPVKEMGEHHFITKVLRAINRRPALLNEITAKTTPVTLQDGATNELFETIAIQIDGARLERALRQVSLGLYRYHLGANWAGPLRIHPEFLRHLHDPKAFEWNSVIQDLSGYADKLFLEAPFHGENKEVFRYQVVFPDTRIPVAIRMHFYGGVRVLALFEAARG